MVYDLIKNHGDLISAFQICSSIYRLLLPAYMVTLYLCFDFQV